MVSIDDGGGGEKKRISVQSEIFIGEVAIPIALADLEEITYKGYGRESLESISAIYFPRARHQQLFCLTGFSRPGQSLIR